MNTAPEANACKLWKQQIQSQKPMQTNSGMQVNSERGRPLVALWLETSKDCSRLSVPHATGQPQLQNIKAKWKRKESRVVVEAERKMDSKHYLELWSICAPEGAVLANPRTFKALNVVRQVEHT